jgi:polyisoprenoid-binding protein YceI
MKLARSFAFGAVVSIAAAHGSVADAALVSVPTPDVSFTAIGPAGMRIVGTTHDLTAREDGQEALTVAVSLSNLTTGIGLRDKHMREKYLEVQTYPTAVLRVPKAKLKLPASGQSGSFDGEGTLTLHGKTKPVAFRYTAKSNGGSGYAVNASMTLDMNDYGIETPKYLGVAVKPSVELAVSLSAEDRS